MSTAPDDSATGMHTGPRRAPDPAVRRRDAERTKSRLLEAAREEFAAKGLSGARVQEIADRAGVDKQLISYYFGGKDGLYAEIARQWRQREREFNASDVALPELATRYLREAVADSKLARLAFWDELGDADPPTDDDLRRMRERKRRGELAADLDEASVILAITGMVAIAAAMPRLVERLFGLSPDHPDFEARYGQQLQRMVARFATPAPPDGTPTAPSHTARSSRPSRST